MKTAREGFSLVEVIVSMMILSVGILAMGSSTGYVLSQVRLAGFMTERNVAVREVSEQLRAIDWSNLESECSSNTFTVGDYTVTCTTEQQAVHLMKVNLVSVGPGYVSGDMAPEVSDTTAMVLAEPM